MYEGGIRPCTGRQPSCSCTLKTHTLYEILTLERSQDYAAEKSLGKWRRMALVVAAFDILLVFSIVILEGHYLVDLVAGIAVAALVIFIQSSQNVKEQNTAVDQMIETSAFH
jgi:PAP2 superfamily